MNKSSLILLFTLFLQGDMSFEEWQEQENQSFINYQSQMDREFIRMLQNGWEEYHKKKVPLPYNRPKPQQQPIYHVKPKPKKNVTTSTPIPKIETFPILVKKQDIVGFRKIEFDFFGIEVEILYNKKLIPHVNSISVRSIAEFWNKQSSCNYQSLINEIKEYQKAYQLDGWGTYLLVQAISQQITENSNSQNLIQWFILVKLGLDVKVGFAHNSISLLIHSNEQIYGSAYFTIRSKRYYNLSNSSDSLRIYKNNMYGLSSIDFLTQQVRIPYNIKNRAIKFSYHNKNYSFNVPYNQNLIDFYRTYPQLPHKRYRKISKISQNSIYKQLLPIVSTMNKIDAINFLLRYTQNGFKYKRDIENFGKEKVLFFEETLAYEYSDCEDRAIFFSILIRELLALDIVFIKYPNHLATAIHLKSNIKGDKVVYKNQNYYIADPTYNGANIAKAMPQLKGEEIKIIEL